MLDSQQTIQALQAAVLVSPDNLPLRLHLADLLRGASRPDEAEAQYKEVLRLQPGHPQAMLGLSQSYFAQGKFSPAMVIVEELLKGREAPPEAHLLHARMLHRAGSLLQAREEYGRAVQAQPQLADADFARELGLRTAATAAPVPEDPQPRRVRAGADGGPEDPPNTASPVERRRAEINFADVGGMEQLKEQIRLKIIHPLTHQDLYKAYGKKIGGGIMLYGPPGCGKTHIARATAGEIDAGFVSVGIHDVLDMWLGNSEKNLHNLFEDARAHTPCVLFFDEVDALAASRGDMRTSAGRHLINEFLAEMDGVKSSNDGLLILAATNAPWHVDAAFRRPGRFDQMLFVPPPDAPAAAQILRILCRGKPVEAIDFEQIAKKTEHFSGADLRAVVDVAVEKKLSEAMRAGVPKPIATRDLAAAAATVKASTREWFSTARNYAIYANQAGIYDELLGYFK